MRSFPTTALLVATIALTASSRQPAAAQPQPAIAIVGATIIDGNGGPPLTDGTLVTQGDRIAAVGPRASVEVPVGATVIDGAGRYVTPGFIDTNVHLSLYSGHETLVRYEDRNAALTLEAAQMQLKHGFTTVRDSYGSLFPLMEIRDAIARGDTIGPRMLVAGNIVGWGGPYTVSFSLIRPQGLTLFQEQFNDFITQGSGEEWMEMEPEDLRVAVNRYLDPPARCGRSMWKRGRRRLRGMGGRMRTAVTAWRRHRSNSGPSAARQASPWRFAAATRRS